MQDIIKLYSKELNINIKILVYLPFQFEIGKDDYEINYYLFDKEYPLKESKDKINVAIFPYIFREKNKLLYDVNSSYNFMKQYQSFIINEVKPFLTNKYKININQKYHNLIGYKELSNFSYQLALNYTDQFGKIIVTNLEYNSGFNSKLISKFNPNLSYYLSGNSHLEESVRLLKMLGAPTAIYYPSLDLDKIETL